MLLRLLSVVTWAECAVQELPIRSLSSLIIQRESTTISGSEEFFITQVWGKSGDQDINWAQNATLAECGRNGVDVHLFEVMDAGEYVYCGRIELVGKPYTEIQPGEDGNDRRVWMFPVRPVPDNDVKKPQMFVFKDMEDYKSRGKNVDAEYAKMVADKKKNKGKVPVVVQPVIPKPEPKPPVVIPADIVGKQVKHKTFGVGVITAIEGASIAVEFDKVGVKKMGYEFCMNNKLLEFI